MLSQRHNRMTHKSHLILLAKTLKDKNEFHELASIFLIYTGKEIDDLADKLNKKEIIK